MLKGLWSCGKGKDRIDSLLRQLEQHSATVSQAFLVEIKRDVTAIKTDFDAVKLNVNIVRCDVEALRITIAAYGRRFHYFLCFSCC